MKRSVALLLVSLFMAHGASAGGYLTPYGTGVTVAKYHVHGEGGITLWVSGLNNPDSCADTTLVHIPPTLPGYKTMVAAVMTAQATGKKVGLYSSNCSRIPFWGGTITYPIISNAWVTD